MQPITCLFSKSKDLQMLTIASWSDLAAYGFTPSDYGDDLEVYLLSSEKSIVYQRTNT